MSRVEAIIIRLLYKFEYLYFYGGFDFYSRSQELAGEFATNWEFSAMVGGTNFEHYQASCSTTSSYRFVFYQLDDGFAVYP